MEKTEARWVEVFKVSLPLCLSYVPIGLACGILLHAAGFNPLLTLLVSVLVFSGGAQFLIASMLTTNTPMQTIVIMLFFLELRYALLGSSLSQYIKGTSKKFLYFFAVSLNDENYAVNYLKFATDKSWTPKDALAVEHWSLLFWPVANFIGSLVGNLIPMENYLDIVDFALTAMFIYMIVMQIRNKLTILVSFISGVIAIVALVTLKSTMGLIVATLLASFIGFMIEHNIVKKGEAKGNFWLKKIKPKASRKVISKSGEK